MHRQAGRANSCWFGAGIELLVATWRWTGLRKGVCNDKQPRATLVWSTKTKRTSKKTHICQDAVSTDKLDVPTAAGVALALSC